MTSIVVKKRVSLDFLGEEYKEGYLVFTAIPVAELDKLQKKAAEIQDKVEGNDSESAKASQDFIKEQVVSRFVEGMIPQDGENVVVTKDNITDLPPDVFIEAWQQMNGKISPKS